MTYTYPKPQNIYNGTVFLIADTVDSKRFSDYAIPYKHDGKIQMKQISHDILLTAIKQGIVKKVEISRAFNGKQFYRIPIIIQLALI